MVLNKDWYVSVTDTKVTEIDPDDRAKDSQTSSL